MLKDPAMSIQGLTVALQAQLSGQGGELGVGVLDFGLELLFPDCGGAY
jgi:hypothetical protein